MPDIHIKISDVERLRSTLSASKNEITNSLRKVEQSLRSADWQDSNRTSFEDQLKTAGQKISQFANDAEQLDRYLSRVISQAKSMGIK